MKLELTAPEAAAITSIIRAEEVGRSLILDLAELMSQQKGYVEVSERQLWLIRDALPQWLNDPWEPIRKKIHKALLDVEIEDELGLAFGTVNEPVTKAETIKKLKEVEDASNNRDPYEGSAFCASDS